MADRDGLREAERGRVVASFWLSIGTLITLVGALLMLLASRPYIHPDIAKAVGGREYFDTLATIVGGRPEYIDTMPKIELYGRAIAWTIWPNDSTHLAVYSRTSAILLTDHRWQRSIAMNWGERGITRTVTDEKIVFSKDVVRGTAAHEFGHWLLWVDPTIMSRYLALVRPDSSLTGGLWKDRTLQWMAEETFADLFAESLRARIPDVTTWTYFWTPVFTGGTKARAFVDSLVSSRWPWH